MPFDREAALQVLPIYQGMQGSTKKTFALVENMLMPREDHEVFEENFPHYLKNCHPDHLAVYYYAHNVDDPEALHQIIKKAMKKYL